ncbi:MAG: hypothetical protein LBI67_00045 [Treponema sp.]|jgi:hypothetical protein|nr:hypothetical protein [Treponema sp.]
MKQRRLFLIIAALFLAFFVTTCTQEPLFYYITREYPPIEPVIGGAPTQIVEVSSKLYVANRKSLWEYDTTATTPQWVQIPLPAGVEYVKDLASTTSNLYLLAEDGGIHQGPVWSGPPVKYVSGGAQSIYGAGNMLFIGTGSAVYADFSLPALVTGISPAPGGLLTGAAYDGTDYYISTAYGENTGIFNITTNTKVYPSSGNASVKGIIAVGSTAIIAVNSERQIIYKDPSGANFDSATDPGIITTSVSFTGAMALWDAGANHMVLLGLQKGSGTFPYGYRELDIDGSWNVDATGVFVPGNDNSGGRATSIDPGSRETSAIGKHPVNSLYVIPSSDSGDALSRRIVVASTLKNGLWSYRARRGVPQWNGEDNSAP